MTRKVLMTVLLSLAALPAVANEFGTVFGEALPFVAQMTQDERRMLRERWEQASPEERAQLRRIFQERLRRMPAEPYVNRSMQMGERMMEPWREGGYGTGYEVRRRDDDERGDTRNEDSRSGYGDDRRGRGRR